MGTAAKPRRENRTIIVDFQNDTTYVHRLGNFIFRIPEPTVM